MVHGGSLNGSGTLVDRGNSSSAVAKSSGVGDLRLTDLFAALRTKRRVLAERDSTMRTASGNFGLRHRRLRDSTLNARAFEFLYSMHRVEKVFALRVDAHAELLTGASQPLFQLGGAFTRARRVADD